MTITSNALSKVLATFACLLLAPVAISRHDVAGITLSFDAKYQINTGSGNLYHGTPKTEAENWTQHFADLGDVVYVRTPASIRSIAKVLPARSLSSNAWVASIG